MHQFYMDSVRKEIRSNFAKTQGIKIIDWSLKLRENLIQYAKNQNGIIADSPCGRGFIVYVRG